MKKRIIVLSFLLLTAFCLCGCNAIKKEGEFSSTESVIETTIPEETDVETESSLEDVIVTKPLTIVVVNATEVDIAMFSIIDPISNEQLQVGALPTSKGLSIEINWPEDVTSFDWAIYNINGELCIEASTEIQDANSGVTLTLLGTDNVESVDVSFN